MVISKIIDTFFKKVQFSFLAMLFRPFGLYLDLIFFKR